MTRKFATAWAHVADHYKNTPMIAAYEVLSEPRDQNANAEMVRNFYTQTCKAVQAADPRTPCMVGSRNYYKLWTFTDDAYLPGMNNIIYTFDYFVPDNWAFARSSVAKYGGTYTCKTLYPGWV